MSAYWSRDREGSLGHMHRPFAMARAVGLVALVGLLVAAGAIPAGTEGSPDQKPPASGLPTFGAAADVVLVDTVVTDKQGQEVKGLTVDDFVVREDGEPQELTSFEAVDLAPPANIETQPPVSTVAPHLSVNDGAVDESSRRVFLIVLNDEGLGLAGALTARKAAKQFLADATRPGDLVSLVLPGAGLTWATQLPEGRAQLESIIDTLKGRRASSPEHASEWEAFMAVGSLDPVALERERLRLDGAGVLPRPLRRVGESDAAYEERMKGLQEIFLRADSQRQLELDRGRRGRLFDAVSDAVDAVASIKGRKAVLLISEGFIQEPDYQPFRRLIGVLRRDNASIYYVDVRRLASGAAADSRKAGILSTGARPADPQESAGAEVAAEQTGGFSLRNPDELDHGLARIAREASSYYLLGYSPTNKKADGKYRHLDVEVRRAGLKVRARKGYYGPSADEMPRAHPDLDRLLAGAVPEREIPLRLTAYTMQTVDKRRVRVRLVAAVDLKALQFEKDSDGTGVATLDVSMELNHVEASGRQRTPWREWKVKLPSQAEGLDIWAPLESGFDVPAGACQAKLAVRDRRSHALGSVIHGFDVPDPRSWRVSTPILSDIPSPEDSGPPRALPSRSFVAGAPLYCYLEVYPGAGKKKGPVARASLAYTLVDAHGKTRGSGAASPFTPNSSGIPARLETIPLAGLSPGAYELRLAVKDEVSGREQELREPFIVRRPSHPDLAIYLELLHAFLAGDVEHAASGVMEWRPQDLEKLAASLPKEDTVIRRGALLLHTALALRLWSNRRAPEAEAQIAICRALLAKDSPPDLHRDWLLALGYFQLALGQPDRVLKALPFFEECTRLFPDAAEAWLRTGTCYESAAFPDGFELGRLPQHEAAERAERSYREAVRLDPGLTEAHLRLGRVLSSAGKLDEAEKELAAAVETSTEGQLTALAQVFWGGLRDARGDLAGAVSHYQAARTADPGCETASLALSEALYRLGRPHDAAEILSSAVSAAHSTGMSTWQAYHLGFLRRNGLLNELLQAPPEAASVAAGAQHSGAP